MICRCGVTIKPSHSAVEHTLCYACRMKAGNYCYSCGLAHDHLDANGHHRRRCAECASRNVVIAGRFSARRRARLRAEAAGRRIIPRHVPQRSILKHEPIETRLRWANAVWL